MQTKKGGGNACGEVVIRATRHCAHRTHACMRKALCVVQRHSGTFMCRTGCSALKYLEGANCPYVHGTYGNDLCSYGLKVHNEVLEMIA